MPLDVVSALVIVPAVTLIAFSVSVTIGLVIGQLGLDEPADTAELVPDRLGQGSEVRIA